MSNDPAADLHDHVAEALKAHRAGQRDVARWKCIFAGVASVRVSTTSGCDVQVPDDLSVEPLAGWFAEGVATARAAYSRRPVQRKENAVRFVVRPGANPAARSCKEDFDL